jgi:hypothetical protein
MPDASRSRDSTRRARWRVAALAGIAFFAGWQALNGRKLARPSGRLMPEGAVAVAAGEHDSESPHTAFEPTDWNLGTVAWVYVGVLVLLVITCFVVIAGYPTSLPDVSRDLRINPPGPRLQTDPESDLRQLRTDEEKKLNTYYWIDKQKGVVHLPIDEAMKKLVETGIPGFPKD